ncbi:MAG: hypothetical protein ABSC37_12250 [Xanthobacteraceae bacterium]|jgi:hypothetical protein
MNGTLFALSTCTHRTANAKIVAAYTPVSVYNLSARLAARHIAKHIA